MRWNTFTPSTNTKSCACFNFNEWSILFKNIENSRGERGPPRGTPDEMGSISEETPWILTNCFLPSIKEQNHDKSGSPKPIACKTQCNIWLTTRSKALQKTVKILYNYKRLLISGCRTSGRKPWCSSINNLLTLDWILSTIDLNSFAMWERIEIGL